MQPNELTFYRDMTKGCTTQLRTREGLGSLEVKILAPTLVDYNSFRISGYQGSDQSNRMSIINELNSVLYPRFTSLWNGDAEDKAGPYRGQMVAIGYTPRHYSILKVSHHGSNRSNTAAWLMLCTADVYVIGGNGVYGNPDLNILQAIIDGHYAKSQAFLLLGIILAPPQIYITNLFFTAMGTTAYATRDTLNLRFRGGATIYQRATLPADRRDTDTGYFRFKITNGEFAEYPVDVGLDVTPTRVTKRELVANGMDRLTT